MSYYLVSETITRTQYEKDGKLVEFDNYEEADAFSDKLNDQSPSNAFWVQSSEPPKRGGVLSQPWEGIHVVQKVGEPDESDI